MLRRCGRMPARCAKARSDRFARSRNSWSRASKPDLARWAEAIVPGYADRTGRQPAVARPISIGYRQPRDAAIDLQRHLRAIRKLVILAAFVIGLTGATGAEAGVVAAPQPLAATVQVYFSPHGGCTEAVVAAVDAAKRSVLVQAYSFTSVPIARALKAAKERGVDVRVILDKSQRSERYTSADFLVNAGIPVWIDEKPAIAHSKVMVIDGGTVVTGSFNFTKAAENANVENLLVMKSDDLAKVYVGNWEGRLRVSVRFQAKSEINHAGIETQ